MNLALLGSNLLLETSLTPMQGCFSYLSEVGSHGPGSEIHLPKSLQPGAILKHREIKLQ